MPPKVGRTPGPSPASLIALSLISVAFGIFINYMGTRNFPPHLGSFGKWETSSLLADLGLDDDWLGKSSIIRYVAPGLEHFLLLITKLFATIGETTTGQGLFLLVASLASPSMAYWSIESQKDGQSGVLTIAYAIVVASLGQVVMIGAAGPVLLIPAYAIARWAEVSRSPKVVHPLPSPKTWKVALVNILNGLILATFFPVTFVSFRDPQWMWYNAAFQFFPLIWLPLLITPREHNVISNEGSAAARQTPRLSASHAYDLLSYLLFALYAAGMYLSFSGIKAALRNGLRFNTLGEHVIFWDCIGCAVLNYLLVLVDSYVDEAKVNKGSSRTHNRRLILEDALIGAPALILLGPGWGMAKYFQRREILAEKARFGIKEQ